MRIEAGAIVARRYRLERALGEGGMGAVWAATHTVTNKTVALKILLGREDPSLRARLVREARAVCAIRHPNVVPVHDVLELEDGAPALVMDMLVGESLRARLDREGRLGHEEVARITLDVLAALEEAHARGIVHRDLKPDNIFLATDGVKVLDFGIAKVTTLGEQDAEAAALTRTDAMLGTPYYMAPEQVFGEKDIDPRADLWAIGVLMYECLAGVRPTEANNLGQIFKIITLGPIPPLTQAPAAYATLVGWCLQRARDARPANAKALREALERVRASGTMDGAEVAAYAPSPNRPSRLPAAILAGVIGIAAIGGGAAFTLRARKSPPPPPPAAAPVVTVAPAPSPTPPPPAVSTGEPIAPAPIASPSTPPRAKAKPKPAASAGEPAANDERAAGKVILKAPF